MRLSASCSLDWFFTLKAVCGVLWKYGSWLRYWDQFDCSGLEMSRGLTACLGGLVCSLAMQGSSFTASLATSALHHRCSADTHLGGSEVLAPLLMCSFSKPAEGASSTKANMSGVFIRYCSPFFQAFSVIPRAAVVRLRRVSGFLQRYY